MELIATIFTLLSVILTVNKNIYCWITGIVGVLLYSFIFYDALLYGSFVLQIIFFFMNIYGWYSWNKVKKPKLMNYNIFVMLFFILGGFLLFLTNDPTPIQDAYITMGSILATYLLANRNILTWFVWLSVDLVSIYVYFNQGLYWTTGINCIFIFTAIMGYLKWKYNINDSTRIS